MSNSNELKTTLLARANQLGALPSKRKLVAKRVVDVFGAIVGLLLFGPLIVLLAILIRLDSQGPSFFSQQRLGRWGKPFTLYKLRTMVENAENKGAGLAIEKNDPRITSLGAILRKTSLDEVPQLWNVLRGDMSFIGPRPLPVSYLERWDERQQLRLVLPQGMSGWSQVTMRNDGPWPERLEKDVEYVEHWSLAFDARVLLQTIVKVVARSSVSDSGGDVNEFTGASTSTGSDQEDPE